ncbi:actin filament-associated protein 1 [Lingula anatina]|uniref:Actin filament-associated protein 1 n=1 Tax=Lingula anatina TaxID=7574 RepID=A0A2R2MIG1_LINAN|nr:actin filament-associated protein 1 [Lingula anatina]|eukprot:XP_023930011.1 actin filament-associated protein 1 [Lingula anatina]
MDKLVLLEEMLPGIEDYLRTFLAKESMSSLGEKKRQYYVERLEALRLPPSLPPRPSGLHRAPPKPPEVPPPPEPEQEDFIEKQRQISRASTRKAKEKEDENPYSDAESVGLYDDLDADDLPRTNGSLHGGGLEEDLYEEPLQREEGLDQTDDGGSDTSYETYDEEDGDVFSPFPMERIPSLNEQDIPLPSPVLPSEDFFVRIRSKKKKKSKEKDTKREEKGRESDSDTTTTRTLKNITHFGDLYHKGKLTWTKRYCVISDKRLLVYKNEKDMKAIIDLHLQGYDVIYMEKEGKRNHVLRISHPGCETLWFSGETKDSTDSWLQALLTAAFTEDHIPPSASSMSFDRTSVEPLSSKEGSPPQSVLVNQASHYNITPSESKVASEEAPSQSHSAQTHTDTEAGYKSDGGCSTGTGQQPTPGKSETNGAELRTHAKKSSLSLGQRASHFFGTFGKKKSKKHLTITCSHDISDTLDTISMDPEAGDTDVSMSGHLNVQSSLSENPDWAERWCLIRHGMLECYVKSNDETPEFVFALYGCEISQAPETGKELAIKISQGGYEKCIIEASNTLRQGRWLAKLIKETGCAFSSPKTPMSSSSAGSRKSNLYEEALPATDDEGGAIKEETSSDGEYLYDDIEQIQRSFGSLNIRTSSRPDEDPYEHAYEQTYEDLDVFGDHYNTSLESTSEKYLDIDELAMDRPRSSSNSSSSAKVDINANIGIKVNGNNNSRRSSASNSRHSSISSVGDSLEELLNTISDWRKKVGQVKRKRNLIRDRKIQSKVSSERKNLEEEYNQLDAEFKEASDELLKCETKLEELKRNKPEVAAKVEELRPVAARRRSSTGSNVSDSSRVSQMTMKLNSKDSRSSSNSPLRPVKSLNSAKVKQKIMETELKSTIPDVARAAARQTIGRSITQIKSPASKRKVFVRETIQNPQLSSSLLSQRTESTEVTERREKRLRSQTLPGGVADPQRPLSGYNATEISVKDKLKEYDGSDLYEPVEAQALRQPKSATFTSVRRQWESMAEKK